MFKAAPQLIARPTAFRAIPRTFAIPQRRLLGTAPPSQKTRSWKNLGARLGAAGGLIYFYNTTDVFAEEPQHALHTLPETDTESEILPTIESISSERQKRKAVQAQLDAQRQKQEEEAARAAPATQVKGGMEELEEEADQQSAFNPETGEINWDCPCLGGMADGPCGEEFKAAFSCFVYSKEEPKGMDCIDNFKNMQTCFRKYPEVYGSEMDSDADDDDEAPAEAAAPAQLESSSTTSNARSIKPSTSSSEAKSSSPPPPPGAEKNEEKKATESSSKPQPEKESSSSLVPDNYKPRHKAHEAEKDEEKTIAESSSRLQPGKESSSPLVPDNYKPGNKH